MYTKNPVSGKNETLVNTSMLRGAVDGVVARIADKADQGALESLSTYTEGVKATIAGKADKADVQSLSEYVEGRLPKEVYETMVDAYVGLACKVADPDILEGAAKMAYSADPVKYATSNPNDEGCAEVTKDSDTIYNAILDAGRTVELPPFLRLRSWDNGGVSYITSWKTELPNLVNGKKMFQYCTDLTTWTVELPNLTNGTYMFSATGLTAWDIDLPNLIDGEKMFYSTNLTSWNVELPNLTIGDSMFYDTPLTQLTTEIPNLNNGRRMFYYTGLTTWDIELPSLINGSEMFSGTPLTSWSVELPNLTDGSWMFYASSLESFTAELPNLTNGINMFAQQSSPDGYLTLKHFRGTLPSLVDGYEMFRACELDIESVRCIAESINYVTDPSISGSKQLDITVGYDIETTPRHNEYVETIKNKGWTLVVNDIQQ